jgi:hypothetical protein
MKQGVSGWLKPILWTLAIFFFLSSMLLWDMLRRNAFEIAVYIIEEIELRIVDATTGGDGTLGIQEVIYHKEGIDAAYPRLISGASAKELELWNRIIKEDFDKIIQIYSFQPYPEPTPDSTDVVPPVLMISYEVKGNTRDWISILYRAYFSAAYTAHPSNLVYTTNIGKEKGRRIRLSDIVKLNEDFVREFRTWIRKGSPEDPIEVQQAIRDYINNITDAELLAGFQAADQIGSNNPWGIFSYMTGDRLGISIQVPHYAGDHAEFEQDLSKLERFRKQPIAKQ